MEMKLGPPPAPAMGERNPLRLAQRYGPGRCATALCLPTPLEPQRMADGNKLVRMEAQGG